MVLRRFFPAKKKKGSSWERRRLAGSHSFEEIEEAGEDVGAPRKNI
jgi:hypothetical protein